MAANLSTQDETDHSSQNAPIDLKGDPDTVFRSLGHLQESQKLCDVTLTAKDGDLKAHRVVLYTQCSALESDLLSGKTQIFLKNVNLAKLQMVLKFAYTNALSVTREDLDEVTEVAKVLGMTQLYKRCQEVLLRSRTTTLDNCFKLWRLAREVGATETESKVQIFALENFQDLKGCPELKKLPADIFSQYITHSGLQTHTPIDRLHALMIWTKEDVENRSEFLPAIFRSHTLRNVDIDLFERIQRALSIQLDPEVRKKISEETERTTAQDRYKKDAPNPKAATARDTPKEKCLILVVQNKAHNPSPEVQVVRPGRNFQVESFGTLPTTYPSTRWISSCVHQDMLYISGLGRDNDEIWQLNLRDRGSKLLAKLSTPRHRHSMCPSRSDRICILGGLASNRSSSYDLKCIASIESLNVNDGTMSPGGRIDDEVCNNWVTCSKENKIFIIGARNDTGTSAIWVYDVMSTYTAHHVTLPGNAGYIWAAIIHGGYLVILAQFYTAVCEVSDIIMGLGHVRKCNKYKSPNQFCALTLNETNNHFVIIGGSSSVKFNPVYTAKVDDVINDKGSGWLPVSRSTWSLGECKIYGAQTTADVNIN